MRKFMIRGVRFSKSGLSYIWARQEDVDEEGCGPLIAALEYGTY